MPSQHDFIRKRQIAYALSDIEVRDEKGTRTVQCVKTNRGIILTKAEVDTIYNSLQLFYNLEGSEQFIADENKLTEEENRKPWGGLDD